MAIEKIQNGMTGAEAAQLIYDNDLENTPGGTVSPDNSKSPTGAEIYNSAASTEAEMEGKPLVGPGAIKELTRRMLPPNYETYYVDRPDLPDLPDVVTVSKEFVITSPFYGLSFDLLRNYSFETVDRPDLPPIILVDKNYIILPNQGEGESGGAGSVEDIELFSKKFYRTEAENPINNASADAIKYANILSKWDNILTAGNIGGAYITKTEVGRTSTKDMPIYTYEFKPGSPKVKVLVTTGMHGSEKVYIQLLSRFFEKLVNTWDEESLLQWIRWNVHFIVVPVLSPSCLEGLTEMSAGGRRVHETDPIPVSWSKSGDTVTLTFAPEDFPDTAGRLDPNNYFSNPNIVGKTWISLFDSSDTEALPNAGYNIASIINGRTITVKTAGASEAEGTAYLYVGVDINRNMQAAGSSAWDAFTSTVSSSTKYSNDWVPCPNDNKGTAPFSLNESRVLRDLIEANPDILFYADFHSGAGNNYLHWNTKKFEGQDKAEAEIKDHQSAFNSDGFARVTQDALSIPYAYKFCVESVDRPAFCLEWEQVGVTDGKNATDALRWLTTFFISFIRHLK